MKKIKWLALFGIVLSIGTVAGCGETQPQTYHVTFEENGGAQVADVDWTKDTALEAQTPEREGYEFLGWFYDSTLLSPVDPTAFRASKDTTLYAKWEYIPKTYTIKVETNGGTTIDDISWKEGTALTVPETTKKDHEFLGWYYDEALTNIVNLNSFKGGEDVVIYASWEYVPIMREIRFYTTEHDYYSKYYAEGSTVDVSAWKTPDPIYFEKEPCPFDYWIDETYTTIATDNFTMPNRSMAFYAEYQMPQMFRWSLEDGVYTSTGAGTRNIKEIENAYYGTYSVDFTVGDSTTTGIGIVWNLIIPETDNPYDDESGCYYWYMHLNPTNGGFQLARVLHDYEVIKTISRSAAPASWQSKWEAYSLNKGNGLSYNCKAVYTPSAISIYIDDELLYTYSGEWVNTVCGNLVGIRTNKAGNIAKNATFTPDATYNQSVYTVSYETGLENVELDSRLYATGTKLYLPDVAASGKDLLGWYEGLEEENALTSAFTPCTDTTLYAKWCDVEMSNGYKIGDGYYVSAGTNSTILVPNLTGRYGKWSVDVTVTDRTTSRVGLLINASVPTSQDNVAFNNTAINGYYMHHNQKANVNFTLATIQKGVYTTHGSVFKYSATSSGAILDYYNRNKDFIDGKTDFVKVRMGIEISATFIKFYIDGELFGTVTKADALGLFDDKAECIGVGFVAAKAGTRFENFEFIPAQ